MFKVRILTFLIFSGLLFQTRAGFGQESTNFTQFYFNPSLLNPSFTGIDGQSAAFLSYRKQWVGIEGAPTIGHFSYQSPSPGRLAFGLNINQDKRGPVGTSSVLVSTGYNIPVNKDVYMRFGISFGAGFFKTDVDALKFSSASTDPVLTNLLQNDIQVLGNSGISIHGKAFHFGIAIPHLFRPDYFSSSVFSVGNFKPLDQLIIHGSYRYYLQNDQFIFEPYFNYRLNNNIPSQAEVAGVLHLKNTLWFGGSYKQDFGISGMAGYKFGPSLAVGYSYSIKNTGLNELNSPSHEIQLGLLFGTRHKNIPVYSFVNSEKQKLRGKLPVNQLARKNQNKAPATVASKAQPVKKPSGQQKSNVSPPSKPVTSNQPAVAQNQPGGKPAIQPSGAQTKPAVTPAPTPNQNQPVAQQQTRPNQGAPRLAQKVQDQDTEEGEDASQLHGTSHLADSLQEVDELERLDRLDDHKDNPMEAHVGDAPHADRYEKVKKGTHIAEIEPGDYLVVGIFKTEANAKKWAEGLKGMKFEGIDYGYQSDKGLWYVHFPDSKSIDAAKVSQAKYRKTKLFRDAWLLTVEP